VAFRLFVYAGAKHLKTEYYRHISRVLQYINRQHILAMCDKCPVIKYEIDLLLKPTLIIYCYEKYIYN